MTRQTNTPLEKLKLSTGNRLAREIARSFSELDLDLNPPYQRGPKWTEDQQVALVRSWLIGAPTGVVILNDRFTTEWSNANNYDPAEYNEPTYACIDGQQRIRAAHHWFNDKLAVPASWFPSEYVERKEETDDGPYVRWSGLTLVGQRKFDNKAMLTVATAHAATIREEAETYILVNGGGTPQTEDDMKNAARVAAQG